MQFNLKSPFKPTGDQPQAIANLTSGLKQGKQSQTLIGVTGSGKTFTIANVIKNYNQPTLVIAHNKTLAAQLYAELKSFFPKNAVHYFVSYYDYYQPEAYIPSTNTYIEKDAKINEEIDRMRHIATQSLLARKDVVIIASVSCIYGITNPQEYEKISLNLYKNTFIDLKEIAKQLTLLQYKRNDGLPQTGEFSIKGDLVNIHLVSGDKIIELDVFGNKLENIYVRDSYSSNFSNKKPLKEITIYPAKHFITPKNKLDLAIRNIKSELKERLLELKKQNKHLEYHRLKEKTNYDISMLKETGYVTGIENYSRHLSFRKPEEPPFTLLDYFSYKTDKNFLTVIDESHITLPQIRGMFEGDRSRKNTLVEYGFRLPSALDNRPLRFHEFEAKRGPILYASATPAKYEIEKSEKIIEQLIRPTGLLEPKIEIFPTANQIKILLQEIKKRSKNKERVLALTLTKRLAEELSEYLAQKGIKVQYLHSDIKTIERSKILTDLRRGKLDVIVGINLLREGLDLPEVSLVIIFDADKEGFLRNETSLIQIMGRASRHPKGKIILFADTITQSIKKAVKESLRRKKIQEKYNLSENIKPKAIKKEIKPLFLSPETKTNKLSLPTTIKSLSALEKIEWLEKEMKKAADKLDFERAAALKDMIRNQHGAV